MDCWSKNRPRFCFRGDLQSSKSWHLTYCSFPCRSDCLHAGKTCQRRKGTYFCVGLCLDLGANCFFLGKHWIFTTLVLKGIVHPNKILLHNHTLIYFPQFYPCPVVSGERDLYLLRSSTGLRHLPEFQQQFFVTSGGRFHGKTVGDLPVPNVEPGRDAAVRLAEARVGETAFASRSWTA